ncbi:MAG: hypothetical protein M3362_05635 [Acidobacteriota bacterium]|nr:hypothetical protein [Acidobacteriota bacterium]
MTAVIVSGALANKPLNGGAAWTRLSWILGLKKLGLDVLFVEQIDDKACVNAEGQRTAFEDSVNLAFFKQVTNQFGLSASASLIHTEGEGLRTFGLGFGDLLDAASDAKLLVNITGHLKLERLTSLIQRKLYIDLDPGFTQFWQASGESGSVLEGHDFYFTVGENIGTPHCSIPTGGVRWRPVRQPVVLEHWPVSAEGDRDLFTTIASWRGAYGRVEHGGKTFGLKAHEFRKFIELPGRAEGQRFEIALDIHPAEVKDLELLRSCGWRLINPQRAVPDPHRFRRYVQNSGGEFSVAQGIYVETGSGWFSDRTVRYLASGKPALVQDTGFSCNYPTGSGLVAFRDLDEAVEGVEIIARDYEQHCEAARTLAEEYFDSDKVLSRMLDEVGLTL